MSRTNKQSVTLAKVAPPTITGVFLRERLFDELDRMRERPVTWVSGPGGCGKTTVVASYLVSRELPCLWYQVDDGDNDLPTFFYYMGLAAKRAAPRTRKPLPLLTPEYLSGLPAFTLRYFEGLYNRLNTPCALVFDNYQKLPPESPLHEVLRNALSVISEDMNVILISREDPPPVLTSLYANNLMGVLGWNALRLTQDETERISLLRIRSRLSEEIIKRLHSATDGWAAGLVLMLERAKTEGIDTEWLGKFTPDEIFDYFAGEIFDKVDQDTRGFFLKTAFLPYMTPEMAEALTGLPNAGVILSQLNRNNLFTEKRFRNRPSYQFHPLFRKFLLARAKETYSKEELPTLRREAGMILERAGETEEAISFFRDAEDWDGMARLIMEHAPTMLAQGRSHQLEEWLRRLPEEIVAERGWLLYWMGACRLAFDPSSSRACFEKAFERFRVDGDRAGLFPAWSGMVESTIYAFEDFKPLDKCIQVFEGLLEEFDAFPSEEIRARVVSAMFTALVMRQPQHPDFETWAERATSLMTGAPSIQTSAQLLIILVFHRLLKGDFDKAAHAIESSAPLTISADVDPFSWTKRKYAEAIYFQFTGMHEKCLKAVSDGLEVSRKSGAYIMDHLLLCQRVWSALNRNDHKTAGVLLEEMARSLSALTPYDRSLYHFLRSRTSLIKDDLDDATLHADEALKLINDIGCSPIHKGLCYLLKAQVMHAIGRHREAGEHLAHVSRSSDQMESKLIKFHALLMEAQFLLDRREREPRLRLLRDALAMGREHGYFNNVINQPAVTASLCAVALEAGIEVDYVRALIRQLDLFPEKPAIHLENWPWPLQVYTLGRFELIVDGQPVDFTRKAQQKPVVMLKVLIALGGKGVSGENLSDVLWPEARGDLAHQSYATTLHRLRRLIRHPKAIVRRAGRLTLSERYFWTDVWAFERLIGEADAAWGAVAEGEAPTEAIDLTQKAFELYKGPFLAFEMDAPWSISIRQRTRSKFLRGVRKLGQYLETSGHWEEAMELYQKSLEKDNLIEDLYRRLMSCCHRLGQRNEALSVYERCRETLSTSLGLDPSPETEAMRKALLAE